MSVLAVTAPHTTPVICFALLSLPGGWCNDVDVFERFATVILDVVPSGRWNVCYRRRREDALGLPFDQRGTLAVQDHEHLLVLARGMPADGGARLEPDESASHSRRLRRSF